MQGLHIKGKKIVKTLPRAIKLPWSNVMVTCLGTLSMHQKRLAWKISLNSWLPLKVFDVVLRIVMINNLCFHTSEFISNYKREGFSSFFALCKFRKKYPTPKLRKYDLARKKFRWRKDQRGRQRWLSESTKVSYS